ncbi:hypothetical protein SARC_00030 [Sphaeroforma arctica JP610]|uniref:Uncharacterized protein n=1 Tax=Sphaeroforma arctica JP610 TaxID=667725 RepID=A0A0L0GHS5_9EUKA|nr:hypothetical protein SARC_00030 [Sphaeroforma arctica JP610]KNC87898.1 hypothetical protein SARC_00030 [Sphaeroforma arctica JP610]|eukprot:XP_014161800.1 hypothetical protein SARC_00030 [Sphaeroforma arctica JP610]
MPIRTGSIVAINQPQAPHNTHQSGIYVQRYMPNPIQATRVVTPDGRTFIQMIPYDLYNRPHYQNGIQIEHITTQLPPQPQELFSQQQKMSQSQDDATDTTAAEEVKTDDEQLPPEAYIMEGRVRK